MRTAALLDLNHNSGAVYGAPTRSGAEETPADRINRRLDAALTTARKAQRPRDYLGASRIGEPCSRRLVYEMLAVPPDAGRECNGQTLRIFDAGHLFEDLVIRWLRAAGFDLRTTRQDGGQFGFTTAGGRFRGHIDGVIVAGPEVGLAWPALWENKSLNARSWEDTVRRGVHASKPLYWTQVQIYMAYLDVPTTLFTAINKNTQELLHEVIPLDLAAAQTLSDKAVSILRDLDAQHLPSRAAADSDAYFCRFCPYAGRCWEAPV